MIVFEGHLVTRPKVTNIPVDIILQAAKFIQNFDSENVSCHEWMREFVSCVVRC